MVNCTLKATALLVAVIDMVGAALIGIYVIIAWGIGAANDVKDMTPTKSFHPLTYSDLYNDAKFTTLMTTCLNVLLLCILKSFLGFTLKQGIEKNHLLKCKIWLISTTVILGACILVAIYYILQSSHTVVTRIATIDTDSSTTMSAAYFIGVVIWIVYETFCMFIISMYMKQMFGFGGKANASSGLEVRLELNGKPVNVNHI